MARKKSSEVRALVRDTQKLLPLRPMKPPATVRWSAAGLLADWLLTRQSPKTQEVYREDMKCLSTFLECTPEQAAQGLLQGRAAAEQILEHWDRWQRDVRGLSPYTRARRIWAAQSFCKHAARREVIAYQVAVKVPKLITRKDTSGPAHKKLDEMLVDLACGDDPQSMRDAALIGLLYGCGLRRGEVLTMRLRDCDPDSERLMVVMKGRLALVPKRTKHGKLIDPSAQEPDREQLRGVPKGIWRLLASYIEWLRAELPEIKRDAPLWWSFGTRKATPCDRLGCEGLGRMLRRRLKQHKMKPCTSHGMRHSAITKCLDASNGNLRLVQGFARHADLRQLHRYDDARRGLFAEGAKLVADSLE
jgi:site-specific recombinase XerC